MFTVLVIHEITHFKYAWYALVTVNPNVFPPVQNIYEDFE